MSFSILITFTILINLFIFFLVSSALSWYNSINRKLDAIEEITSEVVELSTKFAKYNTNN